MVTFHAQIKDATDQAHREAEEAPFIEDLMAGRLSQMAYLDYLIALQPIYLTMESLLFQRSDSALLEHFDHRSLDRSQKLTSDISHLSTDKAEATVFSPAVTTYLQRLNSEMSDAALLAHHYIRYLGDLSGGQAISRLVSRHYSISQSGLNFYNFDNIGDVVFYKKRYRDLLNLVSLSEEEKSDFLNEVRELYALSKSIFVELGMIHKPAQVA